MSVGRSYTRTAPTGGELGWPSWRTVAAHLANPLTMAGLTPGLWAIGHSASTTVAILQQDDTILADRPDSPFP
ncbi:hypothetical protein ACFY4K_34100 [Streptomyces leeuwenhoekii]|uniref:hypothetical protein n=1 Tax=Streptomyces leeuwenhoekii TaxID=1437453 RepID=UPI0036A4CB50